MILIAVDPGASGSCVFGVMGHSVTSVIRNPEGLNDPNVSTEAWRADLPGPLLSPITIVREEVGGRRMNGANNNFSFGYGTGRLDAMLEGAYPEAEWLFVRPLEWMTDLGCRTRGDKNVTRELATRIFPDFKVTHANADALLIWKWANEKLAADPG